MMREKEEYMQESKKAGDKLCQTMQKVPDAKRRMLSVSAMAYLNGLEAGLALAQDEHLARI